MLTRWKTGLAAGAIAILCAALRRPPAGRPVPRRRFPLDAPPEAVLRQLADASEPVILEGSPAAMLWPAMKQWTPQYLAAQLEGKMPLVDESTNATFVWYDESRQMHRRLGLTSHSEHLKRDDVSSNEFFVRSEAGPPYRQLSSKIASSPLAHLAADVSPHDWMLAARDQRYADDVSATMWAGDAGTTSHTHYDGVVNCFAQVIGRKEFALWPPEAWETMWLYPHAHPAHRQVQHTSPSTDGLAQVASLGPGDVLFLPPFHFHRVTSRTMSVAVSVTSKPEQGTRFDRACRLGLPSALLDRTASPRALAVPAQRYLSTVVLAAMPNAAGGDASRYVSRAISERRYRPMAADLMCDVGFDGGACAAGGVGSAADATGEERALATAVGDILRGCDRETLDMMEATAPASAVWPAAAGGGAGAPARRAACEDVGQLDAPGHIVLQDYVEHVAGFAVGMRALCGFIESCL